MQSPDGDESRSGCSKQPNPSFTDFVTAGASTGFCSTHIVPWRAAAHTWRMVVCHSIECNGQQSTPGGSCLKLCWQLPSIPAGGTAYLVSEAWLSMTPVWSTSCCCVQWCDENPDEPLSMELLGLLPAALESPTWMYSCGSWICLVVCRDLSIQGRKWLMMVA